MIDSDRFSCPHTHNFLSEQHRAHERRTWLVICLTVMTMVGEIISGLIFGSMALLADGWHMASHASAMGITALAYYLARKHRHNQQFTFGTGKINDLAAYSSALLLVLIAFIMAYESIKRLLEPVTIHFNEAIIVAVIGLIVNLASAFILNDDHDHHDGEHDHVRHPDHNLRAAYLHVLADALTSILAIVALTCGKIWNWAFLDPLMGVVGAAVITRWSYGLLRDSGRVLLDNNAPSADQHVIEAIRSTLESVDQVAIDDLHVWRIGPGHYSAVISLTSSDSHQPRDFKDLLCGIQQLSHVTVEVNWPRELQFS